MPRIPWWAPEVGPEERRLVLRALKSTFLNDGPLTARLEGRFRERLGVRYAVALTSGTSAIFLGLKAVGVGPGDEVLIPDLTFIATANAVSLTGAKPVFVDVDPGTLTIDPAAAARAVTKRTKAIVPVHVSGRAADMRALKALARRKRLRIVEDAAEALGSRHRGRALGTFGDIGCFSMTANKIIMSGQGGMAVTNNAELHRRLRELKDHGRPKRGTGGADIHASVGYNFKYTDLQAAVALGQWTRLSRRGARMRAIYRAYRRGLKGVRGIELLPFDVASGETPLWVDALADDRDGLVRRLESRGAGCRKFWLPLHAQRPYRRPGRKYPVSARASRRAFWLPSAFSMSDRDVTRVCRMIREFAG